MTDQTNNSPVDGFSDNLAGQDAPGVDAPDRGVDPDAPKPLSPEEYAALQKDAREEKPTDGHPERARE